jgi:hypothetical protein
VSAIAADGKLTAEEKAARRGKADQELEALRAAAARRWEERRREVVGQK